MCHRQTLSISFSPPKQHTLQELRLLHHLKIQKYGWTNYSWATKQWPSFCHSRVSWKWSCLAKLFWTTHHSILVDSLFQRYEKLMKLLQPSGTAGESVQECTKGCYSFPHSPKPKSVTKHVYLLISITWFQFPLSITHQNILILQEN